MPYQNLGDVLACACCLLSMDLSIWASISETSLMGAFSGWEHCQQLLCYRYHPNLFPGIPHRKHDKSGCPGKLPYQKFRKFSSKYPQLMFVQLFVQRIMWSFLSCMMQRDTIHAASQFAARNQLPEYIRDEMLSHICLRYKTESLKQKETLDSLPKGIRSGIAYHLFFHVIEKVYLFRGVSYTCMLQLVWTRKIVLCYDSWRMYTINTKNNSMLMK